MSAQLTSGWATVIAVLAIWELVWKGLALWRASRRNEKLWYVLILVINSVGLLPIAYLLLTKEERHD